MSLKVERKSEIVFYCDRDAVLNTGLDGVFLRNSPSDVSNDELALEAFNRGYIKRLFVHASNNDGWRTTLTEDKVDVIFMEDRLFGGVYGDRWKKEIIKNVVSKPKEDKVKEKGVCVCVCPQCGKLTNSMMDREGS